tara:strand:+ start:614 stop:973 length:360 start_codon:yes stop_codon:yes gene_type:complete
MAALNTKIKLYLEANSKIYKDEFENFVLQNDGSEDYIKSWNVSDLNKPTDEQLASYETTGNTKEAFQVILSNRRNNYPSIGDQLDMLWHSIDQNPALKSQYFEFYEAIKAVKVKYPKNG